MAPAPVAEMGGREQRQRHERREPPPFAQLRDTLDDKTAVEELFEDRRPRHQPDEEPLGQGPHLSQLLFPRRHAQRREEHHINEATYRDHHDSAAKAPDEALPAWPHEAD